MTPIHFLLNRVAVTEQAAAYTPLLDVIRRNQRLTGCKEACREGDCGACLVLLGKIEDSKLIYRPATACLVPWGAVAGQHVVTIEGLNDSGLNPIQRALVDHGGIQCGFCTPGIVVALTAFCLNSTSADVDAAIDAVAGNLCRCTGYIGIKRAIRQLCSQFDVANSPLETRLANCIEWQLLPDYFTDIARQLMMLPETKAAEEDDQALPVAGGTDLMVQREDSLFEERLRFLPSINGSDCVHLDGSQCRINALTSIEQLRTSPLMQELLPTIGEELKLLCSAPVRQRATVGGNLANASPIADMGVYFLALDATLCLGNSDQQRSIRLRDFFIGYKQTVCHAGEQLLEISFDRPEPSTGFSFEKVSKRTFLDIASVNSALSIHVSDGLIDKVHLAVGGVAPIPLYLTATCAYLIGKPIQTDIILHAATIAQTEISPISDLRGSIEYKRLLFRQLFFAHFLKLFPQHIGWKALYATE